MSYCGFQTPKVDKIKKMAEIGHLRRLPHIDIYTYT